MQNNHLLRVGLLYLSSRRYTLLRTYVPDVFKIISLNLNNPIGQVLYLHLTDEKIETQRR